MINEKSKSAILLFGTFNPVTNAHLELGRRASAFVKEADVYYVPASGKFLRDWKMLDESSVFSEEDRLFLLQRAVEPYGFFVSDLEVKGVVSGKTYDTITYFKTNYEYHEIYVVIGSDKLKEIGTWVKAKQLLSENNFLVFDRSGDKTEEMEIFDSPIKDHFLWMESPSSIEMISSTKVRECFHNGNLLPVKKEIPEVVYRFLADKMGGCEDVCV